MRSSEPIVVTGIGIASPAGHDLEAVTKALREGRSGIRAMPEWKDVDGLTARVAGLVEDVDLQSAIPRK